MCDQVVIYIVSTKTLTCSLQTFMNRRIVLPCKFRLLIHTVKLPLWLLMLVKMTLNTNRVFHWNQLFSFKTESVSFLIFTQRMGLLWKNPRLFGMIYLVFQEKFNITLWRQRSSMMTTYSFRLTHWRRMKTLPFKLNWNKNSEEISIVIQSSNSSTITIEMCIRYSAQSTTALCYLVM